MAENNRVTEQKDRQRQKDEKKCYTEYKDKVEYIEENRRKIKSETTSEQRKEKLMIRFFMHRVI